MADNPHGNYFPDPLDRVTSGLEGFVSVTNAWWFVNGVFRGMSAH